MFYWQYVCSQHFNCMATSEIVSSNNEKQTTCKNDIGHNTWHWFQAIDCC